MGKVVLLVESVGFWQTAELSLGPQDFDGLEELEEVALPGGVLLVRGDASWDAGRMFNWSIWSRGIGAGRATGSGVLFSS